MSVLPSSSLPPNKKEEELQQAVEETISSSILSNHHHHHTFNNNDAFRGNVHTIFQDDTKSCTTLNSSSPRMREEKLYYHSKSVNKEEPQQNPPPCSSETSPPLPFKKRKSFDSVIDMERRLKVECKNDIERRLLCLLTNNTNVKIMIMILCFLATLQSLKSMTLFENILSITLFSTQLYNLYYGKNIEMAMTYEESFKRLEANDKQRTIISIILFSTRMILLPEHRMIFLPSVFIWIAGSHKMYSYSTFWGLFPTYYLSFLFVSCGCYFGYNELIEHGYTSTFIEIISEYTVLFGCVWMYSYYLVNVTGYLKRKVDKLKDTRKKLESALEARNRFMAHISHEFRCPIMSSIGCLELLKETPLNEKQIDLVDTIVSSNSILLLLIEDILQIVRIEHEKKVNETKKVDELKMHTFNLFEFLKSIRGIILGYASNFKVNLKFDFDSLIKDMFVHSNASNLHQIITNLLTNAVKASKQHGEVWLKCRVLEESRETTKIRFICEDFGCGIPEHLIDSIFEPFVQLHNSQSKVPSSGLGLTTVSYLIKNFDGTISVKSQVGEGSVFTVDIPFKKGSPVNSELVSKIELIEDKRSKLHLGVHKNYLSMMTYLEKVEQGKEVSSSFCSKILIAEDNPVNRKVIVKMINSMGYETDWVSDGKELVDKFNIETHKVVITDMNMPNMNGLEAAKILREKYGPTFKIFLLTGNVTVSFSDEIGVFDGILTKPCSKQDLKSCLSFA